MQRSQCDIQDWFHMFDTWSQNVIIRIGGSRKSIGWIDFVMFHRFDFPCLMFNVQHCWIASPATSFEMETYINTI